MNAALHIEIRSIKEREYSVTSVKRQWNWDRFAKNINKLFPPFKRLTDQGTGTGLGLSIVKILSEKPWLFGSISQPGKGTKFIIYLTPQS